MKKLRKNIIAISTAATMLFAFAVPAVAGETGDVTAVSLLDGYRDKTSNGVGFSYSVDMNLGMTMSVMGQTQDMTMNGTMDVESCDDVSHIVSHMVSVSEDEETETDSEQYVELTDDGYISYTKDADDEEWEKSEFEGVDMSALANSLAEDYADQLELSEEDDTYIVSGIIDLQSVMESMKNVLPVDDMFGDDVDIDFSKVAGADVSYTFDKESQELINCEIDMKDAMQDVFEQAMSSMMEQMSSSDDLSSLSDAGLNLSGLFSFDMNEMSIVMHDFTYSDDISVVIPDEVKNGAEAFDDSESDVSDD